MLKSLENNIIHSKHGRDFLVDIFFEETAKPKPVVIFSHGFKGFKDWGCFDLMAQEFAKSGFVFVKFNFSHNGTTLSNPTEFEDLNAFGNNNFSIELDDLGTVLESILNGFLPIAKTEIDEQKIYLLGHSRGGGITILKAQEDSRIAKICTWASVSEFGKFWDTAFMENFKQKGVVYVSNARTNQQMPLYWQLYENYTQNLHRLFIPDAVKKCSIPFLAIHGTADDAVPFSTLEEMKSWNPKIEIKVVENANHVFGATHPWNENSLPFDFKNVVLSTIEFFKNE